MNTFLIFANSVQTILSNPIAIIVFLIMSFGAMFLHIANLLLKKKNNTDYSLNILIDLPIIFISSVLLSFLFTCMFTYIIFFRDASTESYNQVNKYLSNNFNISQKVNGTLIKDYVLLSVKDNKKKEFQQALNMVYKDQVLTFADIDYLAKKTEHLNKDVKRPPK